MPYSYCGDFCNFSLQAVYCPFWRKQNLRQKAEFRRKFSKTLHTAPFVLVTRLCVSGNCRRRTKLGQQKSKRAKKRQRSLFCFRHFLQHACQRYARQQYAPWRRKPIRRRTFKAAGRQHGFGGTGKRQRRSCRSADRRFWTYQQPSGKFVAGTAFCAGYGFSRRRYVRPAKFSCKQQQKSYDSAFYRRRRNPEQPEKRPAASLRCRNERSNSGFWRSRRK